MIDSTITTQTFLVDLINRVIKNFENSKFLPKVKVKVLDSGRRQLIQPALPHSEDVEQALRERRITVKFLEKCVFSILRDALKIKYPRVNIKKSRKRRRYDSHRSNSASTLIITGEDISAAMKRNCPYVFWC